ncbi:unnamed protein product [Amoebophrya sp. A120]|nr:unnamed protein product [Amoebophrya sp. A120]|eukprot:GSA120T00014372001.1
MGYVLRRHMRAAHLSKKNPAPLYNCSVAGFLIATAGACIAGALAASHHTRTYTGEKAAEGATRTHSRLLSEELPGDADAAAGPVVSPAMVDPPFPTSAESTTSPTFAVGTTGDQLHSFTDDFVFCSEALQAEPKACVGGTLV